MIALKFLDTELFIKMN